MRKVPKSKYPFVWQKDDFYIKIFCSIPNIAVGILLKTDKSYFIIDPGDGILRDLNKEIGTDKLLQVSDLFISHGHHDHVGGLWSFLTYQNVMRRTKPLNIYYPKGGVEIESLHKAFNNVYGKELSYKINLIRIDKAKTFQRKGVKIKPFFVNHREPAPDNNSSVLIPSIGFKFEYDGKTICYGGDTAYCDSLVQMAEGSDLAIIEAGATSEDDADLHMTFDQAIEIGETAGEYFLVHVPD
ncbi:MAG: ribonuclease Z [Melioribacteraceae bacterium]|nr:ribonuclease Z [Melioribacteraceae bacterium]MCF8354571.1 ribonuclease Z [Melioribacteraceae bacterium]MCF8394923.1 ribonuclease Z [Melioribacteraceae bacterium]MCF8420148.1 ribonuclease Z [Melioribacteraceae bacterium]